MNVLIVDDEKIIRDGIQNYVTKKGFSRNQVMTACSSEEAIEVAITFKPDILITDIVMPNMNGIQLAYWMKERFPKLNIIIISAFNEPEYLKSAFKVSAYDYILKPVDHYELDLALNTIIGNLERETREKEGLLLLKKNLEESLPLLRGNFFTSLLSGEITDMNYIKARMRSLDLLMTDDLSWLVLNLYLDNNVDTFNGNNQHLQPVYQRNGQSIDVINNRLNNLGNAYTFHKSESEIVGIVSLHTVQSAHIDELIYQTCCGIYNAISVNFNITTTIGIGLIVDHILELASSYHSSQEAVCQRFILGSGSIIVYKKEDHSDMNRFELNKGFIKELILNLSAGNQEKSIRILNAHLKPLYELTTITMDMIQSIKLKIISFLIEAIKELNVTEEELQINWNELLKVGTLEELERNLYFCLTSIGEYIHRHKITKSSQVVSMVKHISETQFDQPLNVQYIAEQLKISPNYLSTLFKQSTGVNYIDYLTHLRLEKALQLLNNPCLKINEISTMVGYSDQNYFAKIFKKCFGRSPSELRECQRV